MSNEPDYYELKDLIDEQKVRIDALVNLQHSIGLSLIKIDNFQVSFDADNHRFLENVKRLLNCESMDLQRLSQVVPISIKANWDVYSKKAGAIDKIELDNTDQLEEEYLVVRTRFKFSYISGRVEDHIIDEDVESLDYIFNIGLRQYLSNDDFNKIKANDEEEVWFRCNFIGGKFSIVIEGYNGREIISFCALSLWNHLKMKKYALIDDQIFSSYYQRIYFNRDNDIGFYWRFVMKDFLVKKVSNISEIKLGMGHYEIFKMIGSPVKNMHTRNDYFINFHWIPIDWPNEIKEDFLYPLLFKKEPKEKLKEYDSDFEYKLKAFGWDSLLKFEETNRTILYD